MGFLHFPYSAAYYGCKTGVLPCSNKAIIRGRLPHSDMVRITIVIFYSCLVLHTISAATDLVKDPDGSLISKNRDFKLGFFSTDTSQLRYLGIWYNKVSLMDYDRYIWVANRNNPLNDSSGVLILSQDGNLHLLNGRKSVMWTSNVSQMMPLSATRKVVLSDFGNLCLMEHNTNMTGSDSSGTIIWQTFRNPTDSIVANMTLRMTSLNMKNALQSWKTPSDPSYGRYTLGTDSLTHPQIVIWDVDRPIWRSGPWNGNIFLGLLYSGVSNDYADTSMRQTEQGEADLVYTGIKKVAFSHYKFSYDGVLNELYWDEGNSKWVNVYHAPDDKCDFYNVCGAFASCNSVKSQMCRCLRGFRPKSAGEWSKRNWSGGCVRHVPLQCGTGGGKSQEEEGFFRLKRVKGPDLAEWVAGVTDIQCRSLCLANCSCLAYAYDVGAGCMYWSRDLVDIQELSSDGVDLYIRLPKSELGKKHLSKGAIAGLAVAGMVAVAIILCLLWWCKGRRKEKEAERNILALEESQESPDELSQGHRDDLPLLKYANLVDATDNFHERNKLGKGGFGEVYKGKLKDGQEIAVKRLSACSGQGIKEFTNEVVVISKLQHRNLVRLVGFCTKGEEKMLVYEYMPNKSLDAFLFDSMKREILDWGKRFNIIQGICRGLIYLHRDSRLRIIHRDLKASNILLDEDLNPKISDFGMARIFMNNQDEDETKRVVGTYGYMAPEYAMEGQFSEKSDVYSFGVLVVEIVTAQKNNTFWIEEDALSLLGYECKIGVLPCSNKAMIRGGLPHSNMVALTVIIFYSCLVLQTISATTELIKDPDGSMFSKNGDFKLGFFSTNNSQLRYLGIWYNKASLMDYNRYIWVANRNNPLNDSSGVLILSKDGNLQLLNGKRSVIWSSSVSQMMPPSATRQVLLSDFGNLCLIENNTNMTHSGSNGTIIWQTFRNPTDSILPSMKLRMKSLNMKTTLQSWKTPSDPSYGRFTLGIDSLTHPQIVIWDVDRPIWRSGPWNGNIFLGLLYTGVSNDYADTYIQQTEQGEADLIYNGIKKLSFSHYKFSYDGAVNEQYWDEGNRKWVNVYRAPDDKCDFYNVCGAFASCNSARSHQMCRCLRGFRPRNAGEWCKGNWSGGCVRHVPLLCGTGGGKSQEVEGFFPSKKG